MKDIKKIFLTKTIPDFLSPEVDMPYIKFVFDEETLDSFESCLDKSDNDSYQKGLKSIEYLTNIRKEANDKKDDTYIYVHDSERFFWLLEKIIEIYKKYPERKLHKSYNFIRSIWLRMGTSDIQNVEKFLERQAFFLKNDFLLQDYKELYTLTNDEVLAYHINNNDDWFETNRNIVFSIRRTPEDYMEGPYDYDFPAIHFALAKESGIPTCFIYGIQSLMGSHNNTIKEELQPVKKELRNKYVSADFIISLSLFLDYLYDIGIKNIEVPGMQVFNYPYHEHLSSSINDSYSSYTDSDKEELEILYEQGDRSDKVLDYIHTKSMVPRFVGKEDSISYNKTERLIYTFSELMSKSNSIEIISEPYIQSDNMKIKIIGKTNILEKYQKKEEHHK